MANFVRPNNVVQPLRPSRRYPTATGGQNGFTLRQVHYHPPPPNRAMDHHDHVQRGRPPIYKDYAGRHEELDLFV